MVVRYLSTPAVEEKLRQRKSRSVTQRDTKYLAFDLDPSVVSDAFKLGKRILYGDGSQPMVLATVSFFC